jgi:hypothetical protein
MHKGKFCESVSILFAVMVDRPSILASEVE